MESHDVQNQLVSEALESLVEANLRHFTAHFAQGWNAGAAGFCLSHGSDLMATDAAGS
ncbi:MAG: hypothetical protein M3178_06905 [Pseudomonadota bacterium]|nr:hypothetical protein [Pseudomonadota bacterium]